MHKHQHMKHKRKRTNVNTTTITNTTTTTQSHTHKQRTAQSSQNTHKGMRKRRPHESSNWQEACSFYPGLQCKQRPGKEHPLCKVGVEHAGTCGKFCFYAGYVGLLASRSQPKTPSRTPPPSKRVASNFATPPPPSPHAKPFQIECGSYFGRFLGPPHGPPPPTPNRVVQGASTFWVSLPGQNPPTSARGDLRSQGSAPARGRRADHARRGRPERSRRFGPALGRLRSWEI